MGGTLSPRAEYDNFGKLLILPDVEDSDGGKYMCKAKNSGGAAVHYFDVMVEGASPSRTFAVLSKAGGCFDSSSCRAANVADGASSGPADRDRLRRSHQVLHRRKAITRHNMEEKRRTVYR